MAEDRSASIDRIDYDEARQRLTVEFRGGLSVVHVGVPSGVYAAFLSADHQASFYAERVKDTYRRA